MRYISRRLGFYLAALAAAVVINFLLPRLLPGDPAAVILGTSASKLSTADLAAVREALGLSDAPLPQQFVTYLSHLFRGDFGISYSYLPRPGDQGDQDRSGLDPAARVDLPVHRLHPGHTDRDLRCLAEGRGSGLGCPPLLILIGSFPAFFLALILLYVFGVRLNLLAHQPCLSPWGWTQGSILTT